ncbi:MAG: metallophosphoesterase family protein [Anaerolineales bacterium]
MNNVTIGLIADTHVPDRRRSLRPQALQAFADAGVTQILHAGDISIPRVLAELAEVAPVLAVRGNRDWFGFSDLPMSRIVNVGEVRIGLTHGHMNWPAYVKDKVRYLWSRKPYAFEYYTERAVKDMNGVDAVVLGHNHEPLIGHMDGKLVVNPGSACCQVLPGKPPSVALLRVDRKQMQAEIVYLE